MSAFLQHGHTKHVYYLVFELILVHILGNDQYTFPTLDNTFAMDDQILELLGSSILMKDQSLCVVDVNNSTKWNYFLGQLCFVEACGEFCDKLFVKMNLLQVSICTMEIFDAWHALHFSVY
jgi:hypothetical protein